MAIQLRRGDYADFDPSRLLDGELAIVLENDPNTEDGTGTYVSYGDSNVKRLLTADEQVEVPTATTTTAGIVKPDGTTIEVNSSGTISVPSASTSRAGLMSSSDKLKLNGIASGATKNTASSTAPLVDGTASAGSSTDYARADHVHPTDTSRAAASDLTDHVDDETVHVTQAERAAWGAKYDAEVATADEIGLVKPDNETIAVSDDGTLSGIVVKHSDGSTAGPIIELTAKGHAEQDSTTGKNLLPNNAVTTTNNGVTFTVNADGSVTANGTVASGASYATRVLLNTAEMQNLPVIGQAATLTLSGCPSGGSGSTYEIVADFADGSTNTSKSLRDQGSGSTYTYANVQRPSTGTIYIRVYSGTTVSNLTFYPQLELGSTETEYEPYSGGVPSPSPDYPQEIRVCSGRNLLNYEAWRGTAITRGTAVWENNGVTITATADDCYTDYNNTFSENARVKVSEGQTITLSWKADTNASGTAFIFPNGSGTGLVSKNNSVAKRLTYTVGAGVTYVSFRFGVSTAGTTIRYSDIQIERSSVATTYVPYGYVGLEEHSRKNLIKDVLYGKALGSNGAEITLDGWYASDFIPVEPNTMYALSGVSSVTRAWYTEQKAYISSSKTPTSPPNAAFVRINSQIVGYEHPQLEKGATPTDYEPYVLSTTPIPLPSRGWVASLPDGTADTLTLDGAGKVTWERKTNETTQAVTDGVTGTVGVDVLSTTGQIADGATVLYKLATPVIEEWGGRVEMPDVPENCSLSIPELDGLNVKYRLSLPTVLAGYEDRIKALEEAIAELATGA